MMIHTPGPWRTSGHLPGRIVADHPTGRPLEADPFTTEGGMLIADDLQAYGGYMVCESVLPKDKPLIAAAPEMFETLCLTEAWASGRFADACYIAQIEVAPTAINLLTLRYQVLERIRDL